MEWDSSRKFNLIQLVQDRDLLWSPANIFYSRKGHKEKHWSQIAELMGTSKAEVKTQWRTLRVQFMAERRKMKIRSGDGLEMPSKWLFYKAMSFISDDTLNDGSSQSRFEVDNRVLLGNLESDDHDDCSDPLSLETESLYANEQEDRNNLKSIRDSSDLRFIEVSTTDGEQNSQINRLMSFKETPPPQHEGAPKRKWEDEEESHSNIKMSKSVAESMREKPCPDDNFLKVIKDYLLRIPEGRNKDKMKLNMLSQAMELANMS